jgi:hypothetical protein
LIILLSHVVEELFLLNVSRVQVLGFENLVFAIFEFVHALVESPKFRGAVKAGLSDLMYYIVLYMQITGMATFSPRIHPVSSVPDPDI